MEASCCSCQSLHFCVHESCSKYPLNTRKDTTNMAKHSKNGVAAKAAPAPAPASDIVTSSAPDLAGIVLSEEERAKLSLLESETIRYKIALADADMQVARAEAMRGQIRENATKAAQAYVDAVVASAGEHGIDLNDKTVRWNFDTSKMTFTRQG